MLDVFFSSGKSPCKTIYDAEDSFPTGAIRKTGRVFLRPDIINIQALDGVIFNVKYLIIVRNTTVHWLITFTLRPIWYWSSKIHSYQIIIVCWLITDVGHSHVGAEKKLRFECWNGVTSSGAHPDLSGSCFERVLLFRNRQHDFCNEFASIMFLPQRSLPPDVHCALRACAGRSQGIHRTTVYISRTRQHAEGGQFGHVNIVGCP